MLDPHFFSRLVGGERRRQYVYLGLLFALIIIATIFSSGYSRDSLFYVRMFERYGSTGWAGLEHEILQRELFILVLTKVLTYAGLGHIFLFLVHAVISLSVKFYLIKEHSKNLVISLAFFISYFFILHDCTQLRFGMAVTFLYLGLHYLSQNKRLMFALVVLMSTVLFHVASIVFLVMLLFTSQKSLYWILGMILFAVLIYPVNLNDVALLATDRLISHFDIQGTFLNKLNAYILNPSADIHLGLFDRQVLPVYFVAIVIYGYRDKFSQFESLSYKALLLSIFFYILFHNTVDIQVRFSDMFGFSLIFLVPYLHIWLSGYIGKGYAYVVMLGFFAAYLVKFTLYDKMLIL